MVVAAALPIGKIAKYIQRTHGLTSMHVRALPVEVRPAEICPASGPQSGAYLGDRCQLRPKSLG